MSLEAINRVLGAKTGGGNRKVVLLSYANHAHGNGRHAWPSIKTVAAAAEVSVRTAHRIVADLVRDGWLRPGDQQIVDHIRADRRPVVYDLAMTEETRVAWALAHAQSEPVTASAQPVDASDIDTARPDNLSPRTGEAPVENHAERPDNLSPRVESTTCHPTTSRPDTAVSPNLSGTINSPLTPATGEPASTATTTRPGRCARHPEGHPRCRACGTSPRAAQEAEKLAARKAAAARRHAEARAAQEAARARRAAAATDISPRVKTLRSAVAQAKAAS